jgi:hypothetical protein
MKNNITTFESHLDTQYGRRGTTKREEFERGSDAFRIEVMTTQEREEKKRRVRMSGRPSGTSTKL